MAEGADSQRAWPQIPGPGSYDVNCDQRGGGVLGAGVPKFSMAQRTAILRGGQISPGPKYSPRTTRTGIHFNDAAEGDNSFDAPKFTFGTSRGQTVPNQIPGPGAQTRAYPAPRARPSDRAPPASQASTRARARSARRPSTPRRRTLASAKPSSASRTSTHTRAPGAAS